MDFARRLANMLESDGITIPKDAVDRLARFDRQLADLTTALLIPRWARIALAARTVRRVQPLLLASWPRAPKSFTQAVENAVAETELAASQGAVTADQTSMGMAAMAVYASRPHDFKTNDIVIAGYIAYAAAHASFAARGKRAPYVGFVIGQAMYAVNYFEDKNAPGVLQATFDAIWADLRHLSELSMAGKWNDKTPVNVDVFGPMWIEMPKHWPRIAKARTPPKRKKATSVFEPKTLAVPRDLIAFLKADKSLEYNHADAECGLVALKPYIHLRLGECRVITEGTSVHAKDPHRGQDGDYVVKTVELVGECNAYDPEGILTWFPDFRCYGCWDMDHHIALVFPKAKWTDIVADPALYLGAQWNGPSEIAKHMSPWQHGKFKKRK